MRASRTRLDLDRYCQAIVDYPTIRERGMVSKVIGLVIESNGPPASVGEICEISPRCGEGGLLAEVVGFRAEQVLLMSLAESLQGIGPGSTVTRLGSSHKVEVGTGLLGRVLDGLGNCLDGRPKPPGLKARSVNNSAPSPLARERICRPLGLGIRAIDGLTTCGLGQRLGIFAAAGVGKSTLLGMIARNSQADANVIALIGERGREVREFLERDLGEEGLARSVVVVVTADQPALLRIKGALVATAIAEHFRDLGLHVNLMMDSLTRYAMALREVGLAVGEPPTTKGYTPSVFAQLPKLLERAGTAEWGSITGLYTVLVEGDDLTDPVADAALATLDGHVVLSRELASRNHFPAVDVLESVSRVMPDVVEERHLWAAGQLRGVLATYKRSVDLINIGAYVEGSNPEIDRAIRFIGAVNQYLMQPRDEVSGLDESTQRLIQLFSDGSDRA